MNTFQERYEEFERTALGDITDPMQRARLKAAFWSGAMQLFRLQAHIANTMTGEAMRTVTGEIYKEVNGGTLNAIMEVMKCSGVAVEMVDFSKLFDAVDPSKLS